MACFLKWRIVLGVAAGLFGLTLAGSAADDAGLDAMPDRSFIHKSSKTTVKAPAGWTIIPPYRLRKTNASTVLGLEKDNPLVSVTIVWSPIGNQSFSDFIRAAAEEDPEALGEEYATLVAVYGKAKVGRPTTLPNFKVGMHSVFKVLIDDGPEKGRYAGAVYLFEAGSGDSRWRIKVRAVYPQMNREEYIKQVEEVVKAFKIEE
jgi:hypothetical protein